MMPSLMTAQQVATIANVHPKTILKWARRGLLPVTRINRRVIRFHSGAVYAFLDIDPLLNVDQ